MYNRLSYAAREIKAAEGPTEIIKAIGRNVGPQAQLYKAFHVRTDYSRDTGDFYETRTEYSERAKSEKRRLGAAEIETEIVRNMLESYADLLGEIRSLVRKVPYTDREKRFQYERLIIGASREVLGREPLARYPSPFELDLEDLPDEVRPLIQGFYDSMATKRDRKQPDPAKYPDGYIRHDSYDESWQWWWNSTQAANRWFSDRRSVLSFE